MRLRLSFLFLFAVSLNASPMYRVVRIAGPATLIVQRNDVQSEIRLGGIEVTDPNNAMNCLTWTVGSSWVMIEGDRVYRSPDAMCINDELVRRGYARFTGAGPVSQTPVTYLGELNLGPAPQKAKAPESRAKPAPRSQAQPGATRARSTRARRR